MKFLLRKNLKWNVGYDPKWSKAILLQFDVKPSLSVVTKDLWILPLKDLFNVISLLCI